MGWKFYFPEDGEDRSHADDAPAWCSDPEDVAQAACEIDHSMRDGWERGEEPFIIAVIGEDGSESRFTGWHEPSVEHHVMPEET